MRYHDLIVIGNFSVKIQNCLRKQSLPVVHGSTFLPKSDILGEVKDTYLVEVFPAASNVALKLMVILRAEADIMDLLIQPRVDLKHLSEFRANINYKNALLSISDEKPFVLIEFNFLDKAQVNFGAVIFYQVFFLASFSIFNLLNKSFNRFNL